MKILFAGTIGLAYRILSNGSGNISHFDPAWEEVIDMSDFYKTRPAVIHVIA